MPVVDESVAIPERQRPPPIILEARLDRATKTTGPGTMGESDLDADVVRVAGLPTVGRG